MKKTILKTVFSTLLTWVIVTGTVFAFTNTVPHKQDNQIVSAAEWNTIKTTIDNLKNSINFANYYTKAESTNKFLDSADLTACANWQVAKMTATGFTCVEDQKGGSSPNLPSCWNNQYLTTQGGNFICKTLPSGWSTTASVQCPPYKVHANDDSGNQDEFISYDFCTPLEWKIRISLPHILDDWGDSTDDKVYMADDKGLWQTLCKQWGLVYSSHTTQEYTVYDHIKLKNDLMIPYDQNGWNINTIMNNLYCVVGKVNMRTKFSSDTSASSGGSTGWSGWGWGWGWTGGDKDSRDWYNN